MSLAFFSRRMATFLVCMPMACALYQLHAEEQQGFYRRYAGVLDKHTSIVAHVTYVPGDGNNIFGHYYYRKYGRPIEFQGTIPLAS